MVEYSEFDINTGDIYGDLGILEDTYPKEFFKEFEDTLKDLLWYKPLNNLKLPFDEKYTNEKIAESKYHREYQKDPNHRPFTWFFLKESRTIEGYELVDFLQPYLVDKNEDENYFGFFFAVRMRLLDLMKIRGFLSFQLEKNFNNDIIQFEIYLHDLIIKHDNLLNDGKRNIIATKFIEMIKSGENKEITNENNDDKESILAVQTLAIHYLLKAIQPDMKRKDAAKARFIKMLTGKNYDNIYKAVQNPLATRSKNNRIDEMEIVRIYFTDLGITQVLELITKDYKN